MQNSLQHGKAYKILLRQYGFKIQNELSLGYKVNDSLAQLQIIVNEQRSSLSGDHRFCGRSRRGGV